MAQDQRDSMQTVAGEVSNMSATIEEIASTSDEVSTRSDEASRTAGEGREAADAAREGLNDIDDAAGEMADDFSSLQARIAEVDEVVEDAVEGATTVSREVDDIAAATEEQTAMLDEVTRAVTRLTEE